MLKGFAAMLSDRRLARVNTDADALRESSSVCLKCVSIQVRVRVLLSLVFDAETCPRAMAPALSVSVCSERRSRLLSF